MTGGLEIAPGSGEGGHAALLQTARQCLALPRGQAARRVSLARIVGSSLGHADPAAAEEGMDAFEPRPPVEVLAVVRITVEGNRLASRPSRSDAAGARRRPHPRPRRAERRCR